MKNKYQLKISNNNYYNSFAQNEYLVNYYLLVFVSPKNVVNMRQFLLSQIKKDVSFFDVVALFEANNRIKDANRFLCEINGIYYLICFKLYWLVMFQEKPFCFF